MTRKVHIWITFAVPFLILCGCRSVKYVPVETVRTDSVYNTAYSRDSVYILDSVYVHEKGDTVYKFKYKHVFVEKVKRDTLYVERTDSVRVPYPVEKELTRWQKVKMEAGGFAIAAIAVLVLIVFGKMVYKLKKGG